MKEIEYDGFITREEDLMKSESRSAKPMEKCPYPKCEECDKYIGGYCTVPMVITKQIYLSVSEEIDAMVKKYTELENLVYDEILGEAGSPALTEAEQFENITWDEVEQ